jgi:hypothetical protein
MAEPLKASTADRLRVVMILAALAFGAPGCHYPQAVHTYEYVTDYERMSPAYDPDVSLVYVPQETSFRDCKGIIIGDVKVGSAWVDSPDQAKRYATFFRVVLRNELLKLKKFDFVSLDKDEGGPTGDPQGRTLLLEGQITKFDMGSGLLRYLDYFLWFLQAGATDLQVEGRITEAATGKLLVEFVDRRRHLCNTPFGPNPRNFREGYAMKVTTAETAQCLARFIGGGWERLPVVQSGAAPGAPSVSSAAPSAPSAPASAPTDAAAAVHEERQ